MTETFDHIVVGGGAAGCVVTARLASEGGARVLLLEAGYSHRHPLLDMPPGIFKLINGSRYRRYHRAATAIGRAGSRYPAGQRSRRWLIGECSGLHTR